MDSQRLIITGIPGHLPVFHEVKVCRELLTVQAVADTFPGSSIVVCGDLWSVDLSHADSVSLLIDPNDELPEETSE
jgi:hypothetical protein